LSLISGGKKITPVDPRLNAKMPETCTRNLLRVCVSRLYSVTLVCNSTRNVQF